MSTGEKEAFEDFLDRLKSENLDDADLANFIELHVISAKERAQFRNRGITVIGSFTGRFICYRDNEDVVEQTLTNWNRVIEAKCKALGLEPPVDRIFPGYL